MRRSEEKLIPSLELVNQGMTWIESNESEQFAYKWPHTLHAFADIYVVDQILVGHVDFTATSHYCMNNVNYE